MLRDCTDGLIEMAPRGALPVCVYRSRTPSRTPPLVLHLHGGAFQGGSLDDGHFVARLLAEEYE